jgi:hypothetical protein
LKQGTDSLHGNHLDTQLSREQNLKPAIRAKKFPP